MEFEKKAESRTIYLADTPIEVAMLPNGSYCLSQTQVASAIDKVPASMVQFFGSKYFKSLSELGFDFFPSDETLVLEAFDKPINPVSIDAALLYWQRWANSGNSKALLLGRALARHSIYDLADQAFGIFRTASKNFHAIKKSLATDNGDEATSNKQSSAYVLEFPQSETLAERELKLKIKLAELELKKIKSLQHAYDPSEIRKIGEISPQVLIEIKDRLKLSTWEEAEDFLDSVDFGKDSENWLTIKISGDIQVLPWKSLKKLRQICSASVAKKINYGLMGSSQTHNQHT